MIPYNYYIKVYSSTLDGVFTAPWDNERLLHMKEYHTQKDQNEKPNEEFIMLMTRRYTIALEE